MFKQNNLIILCIKIILKPYLQVTKPFFYYYKKKTLQSVIRNYEVVLKRQLIKQLFDKTQLIYSELEGAFICKIIHYEYSFSYVWVETGKLLLRDIDNY